MYRIGGEENVKSNSSIDVVRNRKHQKGAECRTSEVERQEQNVGHV